MNRADFFHLIKEQKRQGFLDLVNEWVDRDSLRPEIRKARNGAVRAGSTWLVLLLGTAILCKVPEAAAATTEQPSASASEPGANVTPSPKSLAGRCHLASSNLLSQPL